MISVSILGLGAVFGGRYWLGQPDPVIVAVLDTGFDLIKPIEPPVRLALNSAEVPNNRIDDDKNGKVDDAIGWNFHDSNRDFSDRTGHGTKVAELVARACGDCIILPLKVTSRGAGITPDDLAHAIRYAIYRGARVLNLSFGIKSTSPALEAAVKEAHENNVVLVTAAGTGIPNPYRPDPLAKVYPQAFTQSVVVGVAKAIDTLDQSMNYGDELDLVVIQKGVTPMEYGSSFAAAEISGVAATLLKADSSLKPEQVRHLLRAATLIPNKFEPQRAGFGLFSKDLLAYVEKDQLEYRAFRSSTLEVDINASEDIDFIVGEWRCDSDPPSKRVLAELKSNPIKKGRAHLLMGAPPGQDCSLRVRLSLPGGRVKELKISP